MRAMRSQSMRRLAVALVFSLGVSDTAYAQGGDCWRSPGDPDTIYCETCGEQWCCVTIFHNGQQGSPQCWEM